MATKDRPNGYWTQDRIQLEANKYPDRKVFRQKDYTAYLAASKRKILDIVCRNMPNVRMSLRDLTEEALRYKTRTEFQERI